MRTFFLLFMLSFIFQNTLIAQEKGINTTDDNGKGITRPLCGGVERWAVKVLTDAAASQVNYTSKFTTIDSLIHIPTTPNQNAPRMQGIEFQSYRITCNITIKKNESDNDYHLVLKDGNETMIGEVPDPVCAVASQSAHVNEFIAARNWVNTHIGLDPVSNVNIPSVDITGVAFVDFPHGQTGAAPNQMEIHPILNIHFTDNAGINATKDNSSTFIVSVNPSIFSESANFHITSDHEMFGRCSLEVYSLTGDRVKNLDVPVSSKKEINYTFNRNGLINGLYIYRILNNESILYEGKIIVK